MLPTALLDMFDLAYPIVHRAKAAESHAQFAAAVSGSGAELV